MKKGCFISGLLILLVSSLGLGCYFTKQGQKTSVKHKWTNPVRNDVVHKTVATGTIKPRKEISIKPQVSGVIEKLYVEAGSIVKAGQKIAKIKLIPSQVNINTAQSSVEVAMLQLQQAERELSRQQNVFDTGLDQQNAKASLDNAIQEANRNAQLFAEGIISEQEYNQSVLQKGLKQTDYHNAQIVSKNNLSQFVADVELKQQQLAAATNNLQLLEEGASQNSKQIANIVVATIDGIVLDVPVELGSSVIERNTFNEGTNIAVIADMKSLIFEGQVDESDVGKLQAGMELELTVGAIEGETFGAQLEYIAPKGVETDGSVKFAIRAAVVGKEKALLRAGYSANADIILDKRENVVTVKESDVIFDGMSTYVEVKSEEGNPEKVEVRLGLSNGIDIEVVKGLELAYEIKVQ